MDTWFELNVCDPVSVFLKELWARLPDVAGFLATAY